MKRIILALFAARNLSPLRLAHLFSLIPLSHEPIVNMTSSSARSKECNRKVVSPLNAFISDQLESCQRLKLKAVKMEQELFDNDDKLTELEEAEVVYMLQTSRDGSVAKPRSMLNKAIFDPWQRSLFSRQRTPAKEPLLAGKPTYSRQ